MNQLTESDPLFVEQGDEPAWHSEHPLFWRWFGYYWLRVRWWLWNHGGRKIYWSIGSRRVPIYKWWIRWCDPGFMPCETCGYVWE